MNKNLYLVDNKDKKFYQNQIYVHLYSSQSFD